MISVTYSGTHFYRVTDIDGTVSQYNYDSRGLLIRAKSPDNSGTGIAYNDLRPWRVKKLTAYGTDQAEGRTLSFSYGYNSTTFTDRDGNSVTYRFDSRGNLRHMQDGFGRAASALYEERGTRRDLLSDMTKLQAPAVQMLKDCLALDTTTASPWAKNGEGTIAVCSIISSDQYRPGSVGNALTITSSGTAGYGGCHLFPGPPSCEGHRMGRLCPAGAGQHGKPRQPG